MNPFTITFQQLEFSLISKQIFYVPRSRSRVNFVCEVLFYADEQRTKVRLAVSWHSEKDTDRSEGRISRLYWKGGSRGEGSPAQECPRNRKIVLKLGEISEPVFYTIKSNKHMKCNAVQLLPDGCSGLAGRQIVFSLKL